MRGAGLALGVTAAQRVAPLPDVAPLAEVDTASWHTVMTTANVREPIVDKLHGAGREIMHDSGVIETLAKDGTMPQVSPSRDELGRFVKTEIVRWGKVVQQAGIAGSE